MDDNYSLDPLKKAQKKRKNSRTKGNTFERNVAKTLNLRFDSTDFCRTPGSGAFATTHTLPEHLKVYGDLITPLQFKFVIECKKGYGKENLGSLFRKKSEFWKFINQAELESKHSKKEFLIIFQQDRQEILAVYKEGILKSEPQYSTKISTGKYSIVILSELLNSPDDNFLGDH